MLAVALMVMVVALGAVVHFYYQSQAQFRQATVLRLVSEAPAMLSGTRAGGDERAMLQVLAAHGITPGAAADGALLNSLA